MSRNVVSDDRGAQKKAAESKGKSTKSSFKSAVVRTAIAGDGGQVRIVKSQAGHVLEISPVGGKISVVKISVVIVAAIYVHAISRTRHWRAESGCALRTGYRTPPRAYSWGSSARHHRSGAACGGWRGSTSASPRLGGGKKGEGQH